MQCGALSCEDLSQWVAESCPDLLDWPRGSEHKWNRPLNKFQTLCVGITAFSQQCRAEFGCLQDVRITSARSRGALRSTPSETVLRAETRALQKMRGGPCERCENQNYRLGSADIEVSPPLLKPPATSSYHAGCSHTTHEEAMGTLHNGACEDDWAQPREKVLRG